MTAAPSGLQWERTRLAWRRTVLTATVVALLALRLALLTDPPGLRALAAAAVMLTWLTGVAVGHRRITGLTRGLQGPARAPMYVAAAAVMLAAIGFALTLLGSY